MYLIFIYKTYSNDKCSYLLKADKQIKVTHSEIYGLFKLCLSLPGMISLSKMNVNISYLFINFKRAEILCFLKCLLKML